MKKALHRTLWAVLLLVLLALGSCSQPDDPAATDVPPVGTEIATDAPTQPIVEGEPTNTDGAETILIPAGTFQMGSTESDALAEEDELPVHQVTLGSFYIYTHEVTNAMYAACVEAGACSPVTERESGPTTHTSDPAYAEYPVTGVNWNMASTYCTWAGGRLPTEAEWEYAARGAESLAYPWGGDEPECERANLLGCATPADTVPVGSYAAGNSPFGVWDMSGNVWEWTQDWYADAYYAFSPVENPLGPGVYQDAANPFKTVRGGGLYSTAPHLRGAARLGINPYRVYDDVGFRCVASEALALPQDYVETEAWIDIPSEGQNAEDPGTPAENWLHAMYGFISCPYAENQIRVDIRLDAPEGTTFAVSVEGTPFTCLYDPPFDLYRCTGPAPANISEMTKLHVDVVAAFPDGGSAEVPGFYIAAPHDCEGADLSNVFSASVSCPDAGFVTATFTYDATDVTWQEVYLRSMDTPLPCEVTGEGVLTCIAPDISDGGFYEFYMYGENDEGLGRKRWPDVPAPEGCPADSGEFVIGHSTSCFLEDIPTVTFYYDASVHGSVKTVQDGGEFRLHVNWAAGQTQSMFTNETPGYVTTMTLCFQDDTCVDVPDITVPACPMDISAIARGFTIDAGCYAPGEEVVFDPAASIHYWPYDQQIVSATGNGSPLTCYHLDDGWDTCSVLPGEVGASVAVNFCFADGQCFDGTTTVRDCPGGEPLSEWSFASAGCHAWPDPNYVFFTVDTGYDWLIPGADVTITATDGIRVYACVVHPNVPGRVYCYGLQPDSAQTLNLCLQQPGQPSDCRSFPDYFNWVSELYCPGSGSQPSTSCSGLDRPACVANSSCQWVVPPPTAGPGGTPYCTNK